MTSPRKWLGIEQADNGGFLISGPDRVLIAACSTFEEMLRVVQREFVPAPTALPFDDPRAALIGLTGLPEVAEMLA